MGALCPTLASSLCQSYLVRDRLPNFIWTNFLEATDHELLQQDNVVNHYARVDAFTTKVGGWSPRGGGWGPVGTDNLL